jgi:hypothetical protein
VFSSKRMGYPRILHIISVLQADYPSCFYQRLSCDLTANLAVKGTLSLVGLAQSVKQTDTSRETPRRQPLYEKHDLWRAGATVFLITHNDVD